jgi:repressor of nif and glnA expression
MSPIFDAGLCVSEKIAVAGQGRMLGDIIVPEGNVGLATVCSVAINGVLLKAGVPVDSRFGGILQIKNRQPRRFVELIHYAGSSLDPSEIFVRAGMTAVRNMAQTGSGTVLASFRELPAPCAPVVTQVLTTLKAAGMGGLAIMGNTGEPVCEIPLEINRIGIVLYGGLNPVAAAAETDIEVNNLAMSTVMRYEQLIHFQEVQV